MALCRFVIILFIYWAFCNDPYFRLSRDSWDCWKRWSILLFVEYELHVLILSLIPLISCFYTFYHCYVCVRILSWISYLRSLSYCIIYVIDLCKLFGVFTAGKTDSKWELFLINYIIFIHFNISNNQQHSYSQLSLWLKHCWISFY